MNSKALLIAKTITAGAIVLLQTGYANADPLDQQKQDIAEAIRTACIEQGGVPDIQPNGTNCVKDGHSMTVLVKSVAAPLLQLDMQSNLSAREVADHLSDMCGNLKASVFFASKEGQEEISCSPVVLIEGTPSVQLTMTVRPEQEGSRVSFTMKPCGPGSSVTRCNEVTLFEDGFGNASLANPAQTFKSSRARQN